MVNALGWLASAALGVALLLSAGWAKAQPEMGHKTLGTIGLDAGVQHDPGFYVADEFFYYRANKVIDRDGQSIPIGLDLDVFADSFGATAIFRLPVPSLYFSASVGMPIASVSVNTDRPEASIDLFGLADLYFQPVRLGWRAGPLDVVAGYALYMPTSKFEPGGRDGVSRGHFTHEVSLGTTIYFDPGRTWQLSALASYELNHKKQGVDVTRGNTIQIQGGAGKRLGPVQVGLAAYALWQVTDDHGTEVPAPLLGATDQAFGLGPEINITLAPIRSILTLRYEHDITVRSRTLGQIFLMGLAFGVYRPPAPQ